MLEWKKDDLWELQQSGWMPTKIFQLQEMVREPWQLLPESRCSSDSTGGGDTTTQSCTCLQHSHQHPFRNKHRHHLSPRQLLSVDTREMEGVLCTICSPSKHRRYWGSQTWVSSVTNGHSRHDLQMVSHYVKTAFGTFCGVISRIHLVMYFPLLLQT